MHFTRFLFTRMSSFSQFSARQVYIVTGGTAGIGFGIVAHILQHNASKIILLSQKEEHANEAVKEPEKYGDTNKVQWIQCDLKDLKQTDAVTKQLKDEKRIDAVRPSLTTADPH